MGDEIRFHEPRPVLHGLAADPLIVVDDHHPVVGPAQADRLAAELVLQVGGLAVAGDLVRGGLADVDDGESVQVARADLEQRR